MGRKGWRSPSFYKPLFLKPVTCAVQRINHVERVVHLLEFLADALDVTVDGTIIDINLIIVSGIHQGVAAFDHTGTHGERLHDEEFGDSERDRFVLSGAHVALRVDAELAALKHLTCRRRRNVSIPSMRGILMSRMARSGGFELNP